MTPEPGLPLTPVKRALLALEEMERKVAELEREKTEPIAIVGLACRFPGRASSPDRYWRLLSEGTDAVTEVPPDRWDLDEYYDPDPETPGKMYTRWAAFLDEVDRFDPHFFGISPREAASIDPQQRLLLEVVWEALEDAGIPPDRLRRTLVGVYVGFMSSDYAALHLRLDDPRLFDAYYGSGVDTSFAAGRISYLLGLQGPSMVVSTACSASLVAVHLACQSLKSRECSLALAGGANLILSPDVSIYSSRIRSMSPEGRCKTFDASADGYVRGEGCGVVALKRLTDALAAGDRIRAVVRGSAIGHDGPSAGLTVPNGAAQQDVIARALASGRVEPRQVDYVEAHGTGTPLGDPIEVRSLAAAYGPGRGPAERLRIGSVKTNLGHLEAAAGIAGLAKVVLALEHEEIPPHLHLKNPSPHIPWREIPIDVPAARAPWPRSPRPRLAGVSSFGLSGMNAHVILEEAPAPSPRSPVQERLELVPISARSPEALAAAVRELAEFAERTATEPLADAAHTLRAGRTHHEHRLAVVARTREDLARKLFAHLSGEPVPGLATGERPPEGPPRVAFVFPGQGSQWPGMARRLLEEEPAFSRRIEECERAFATEGWGSLADVLSGEPGALDRVEVVQPLLFAVEVALAALWESWGVRPDAVVGHSMGEVAAACVAGALTLEDAARVIVRRSRLLARTAGRGAMALLELDVASAERIVYSRRDRVSVAAANGPRSTVISGDPAAIDEILAELASQGVFCRRVKVDVASHSPQMDPLRGELLSALVGIEPREAAVPFYSTVRAGPVDGRTLGPAYWVDNLRQGVLLHPTIERLAADGHLFFVEASPHPVLLPSIAETMSGAGRRHLAVPSLRRDEDERDVLLGSIAALYSGGLSIDWEGLFPGRGRVVSLPAYPWQRERLWSLSEDATLSRRTGRSAGGHPVLGDAIASSLEPGTRFWETDLSIARSPWLADHRVRGAVLFPAAGMLDHALAAAEAIGAGRLEGVSFVRPLVLSPEAPLRLQLALALSSTGEARFQLASREPGDGNPGPWTVHAEGHAVPAVPAEGPARIPMGEIRSRARERVPGESHYRALAERGLEYGPAFQGVREIWRSDGEALGRIEPPARISARSRDHRLHPALLDAALQVLAAAVPARAGAADATFVPVRVESFRAAPGPLSPGELWAHARLSGEVEEDARVFEGDVVLADSGGEVLAEIRGLRVERIEREVGEAGGNIDRWLLVLEWRARPREVLRENEDRSAEGRWILFADEGGVACGLADRLEALGGTATLVWPWGTRPPGDPEGIEIDPGRPESYAELLRESLDAGGFPCRGIVHLWAADAGAAEPGLAEVKEAQERGCWSVTQLVQALARGGALKAPRLWIVTRGAQPIRVPDSGPPPVRVPYSTLWGLGRVLAHEHPELQSVLVDLAPEKGPGEAARLLEELVHPDREDQIALRGSSRYVARLARPAAPSASRRIALSPRHHAIRAEVLRPGVLDSIELVERERRAPGSGEVEIEVHAAGLNFLDVLGAMGHRPDLPGSRVELGGECAGKVVAVGEGVERLEVGDEVVALAPSAIASFVTTRREFVVGKAARLSFLEAATIPIAYMTAVHALERLARLSRGERVLVHSASGGVGLAAIAVARAAGAEVLATAGSEERRAFLASIGIRHVFDSRSNRFAEEVLAATGGRGVDVVLNSLAGRAVEASLAALAPGGRFIEIGKRDVYENARIGLAPFRKNLTYSFLDLLRMTSERPGACAALLSDVVGRVGRGELPPLRHEVHALANVAETFRRMARAAHVGKIVFSVGDEPVPAVAATPEHGPIRRGATYLVTGGFGGLGIEVARWMVERGAGAVVLFGRAGPSPEAELAIGAIERRGGRIVRATGDVSRRPDVEAVLARIARELPPLAGVVHSAAVLEDATIAALDRGRFERVLAPKVGGGLVLHEATRGLTLDFLVLFSSAAALLGSPGQANYSAANAFLDALAHHRRAQGLPALSIDWGAWSRVGLAAARAGRGDRMALRGSESLSPEEGIAALDTLLSREAPPQVGVLPIDLARWREFYPRAAEAPIVEELAREAPEARRARERPVLTELRAALSGAARRRVLENHLRGELARVLRLEPQRIAARAPLGGMGLDSLMTLELRNRIEDGLGVRLSATVVFNYPTLEALVGHLAERMGVSLEEEPAPRAEAVAPAPEVALDAPRAAELEAGVGALSDDEVRRLLAAGDSP